MPGMKISKTIRQALPEDQREGLEQYLWDKSAGFCHLCDRKLNQATDDIEADHDDPAGEDGPTTRDNLKLAHLSCNRAKRNYPTVDVRPWLKLRAYAHENGGVVSYTDLYEHFGFSPMQSHLEWTASHKNAVWQLPNGAEIATPVFRETDGEGDTFDYCFLEAPREAVFNDEECQPRTIKVPQAWAIYADTQTNPLHEPPSCRTVPGSQGDYIGIVKLAMFDGQHKSAAMWMHGRQTCVFKVYLNLNKDQTMRLVLAIQSRIRKLPLSSFEDAMKLGDEWAARVEEYANSVTPGNTSEAGLIAWLKPQERKKAKAALKAKLLTDVLEMEDLKLLDCVSRAGREKKPYQVITENQFKTKLVQNLRCMTPLTEQGDDWQKARAREMENIRFALDTLADEVFLSSDGSFELDNAGILRRRRFKYQSALAYVAGLIRKLYRQVLSVDEESRALLDKEPDEDHKQKIQQGIHRIAQHPIWTCDLAETKRTKAVSDALTKNQDAAEAFKEVELRLDYVIGEQLPANWKGEAS